MRILFALLLIGAMPVWAETPASSESELRRIEREQHEKENQSKKLGAASAQIQAEVARLKRKLVEVSDRMAEHEKTRDELQTELSKIVVQEAALSAQRAANQKDLSEVLAIVLRLSRMPPDAMVFSPTSPQQTMDIAIGMHAVMQELDRRVAVARQQLGTLADVHEKLRAQQKAVAEAEAKIIVDRAELADLVRQRETARLQTDSERMTADKEARALAAQAADLRELIIKLQEREAARRKNKSHHAISSAAWAASGPARVPVAGHIIRVYGEADSAGNHARGITIATQSGAIVDAPRAGQVVFAGEFRSYGQVVIIEIAEGQHILLTGLENINVTEGESVQAGEPVGRMPEGSSSLYLETRKDGEPVDPTTFGLTQSD